MSGEELSDEQKSLKSWFKDDTHNFPSASFFLSFALGALDFRASSLQARICAVSSAKFVLICYSNDRKLTQFSINVSSCP